MYVIITGNPIDGLNFFGPFANRDDAIRWGENHNKEADWWLADVTPVVRINENPKAPGGAGWCPDRR